MSKVMLNMILAAMEARTSLKKEILSSLTISISLQERIKI